MPSPGRGKPFRRFYPLLFPLLAISVFAGCATTNVRQTRNTPVALSSNDAIAVVLDHFWYSLGTERIGESQAECVVGATSRKAPGLRVLSPADFREAIFPGFEAAAVPGTPETLALLMDHPEFRSRLESHGIRYLVLLRGGTRAIRHGSISCEAGYRWEGGCYGVWWWDKTTDLGALIMDTQQRAVTNEITATANGTPWFAVIFIAPVGIPVSTEYPACQAIGESIAFHLSGGASGPSGNESPDPAQGTKK
ncbi:MAG TPA: hypothetical protein DCZ97_11885 [Syntrophus sp. (in: bacteria)]|nr:hypothetical protein [Syntrophus sp. (in: bacteria)]